MHAERWIAIVAWLLVGGCSPGPPSSSHGATDTTASASTSEATGNSTDTTNELTTGTTSTGATDTSTAGSSTGSATEASTAGSIECMPPQTTGDTTGTTGDTTGTTGEALTPIESWQEYVAAECAAFVACGCAAPQGLGKDLATCTASREAELAGLAAQGYAWDADCAALRVAAIAQECADEAVSCEASSCRLFHGTAAHADPCWAVQGASLWSATECAAGLDCSLHTCITPCTNERGCGGSICTPAQDCFFEDINTTGACLEKAYEGQHCNDDLGPLCLGALVCVPQGEFQGSACVDPGAACEACDTVCEPGLYCDGDPPLCWPSRPVGAPCAADVECQTRACKDGQCAPLPGEGEECPHDLCAEGLACGGWPKVCYPIAQRGEPCLGHHCAPGLKCTAAELCEPKLCSAL